MIVFNYTTGGLTERELKNYNKYNLSVYSKLFVNFSDSNDTSYAIKHR